MTYKHRYHVASHYIPELPKILRIQVTVNYLNIDEPDTYMFNWDLQKNTFTTYMTPTLDGDDDMPDELIDVVTEYVLTYQAEAQEWVKQHMVEMADTYTDRLDAWIMRLQAIKADIEAKHGKDSLREGISHGYAVGHEIYNYRELSYYGVAMKRFGPELEDD